MKRVRALGQPVRRANIARSSLKAALLILALVGPGAMALSKPPVQTDEADLSGVWWITDYAPSLVPTSGKSVPFTALGRAAYDKNQTLLHADKLVDVGKSKCLPEGVTRTLFSAYPMQILQHGAYVTLVHEVNHTFWSVALAEPHPKADDFDPAFMGDSTGRWENGVLVVDSIGFKADSFLDDNALPHGEKLHVVTRLRTVGQNQMEVAATISDPEYFSATFTVVRHFERRPDVRLQEYVCREPHRVLTGSRVAGVQLNWSAK